MVIFLRKAQAVSKRHEKQCVLSEMVPKVAIKCFEFPFGRFFNLAKLWIAFFSQDRVFVFWQNGHIFVFKAHNTYQNNIKSGLNYEFECLLEKQK